MLLPSGLLPLDLAARREVYDGAISRGRIPLIADLAESLSVSEIEIRSSLQRLADAHMLVLQTESGEILMANPFSAVPTPFVVKIKSLSWFGNCIWDAMGTAAMVGADAVIETSCGCCGSAMRLHVPGECRDDDPRRVHFAIPAARWWDDIVFN
jgi:hypothetical protein